LPLVIFKVQLSFTTEYILGITCKPGRNIHFE